MSEAGVEEVSGTLLLSLYSMLPFEPAPSGDTGNDHKAQEGDQCGVPGTTQGLSSLGLLFLALLFPLVAAGVEESHGDTEVASITLGPGGVGSCLFSPLEGVLQIRIDP